ncbi:MAG: sodium:proton exchanger, partial [Nitrospirota bacterium]|nr:sodium:proton exchanger [Nitrospirota bacterium]
NPDLFIIARTRYITEVDDLLKLGADEVIPEEFETSIEIFSKVLVEYQTPKNEIFNFIDKIREDGYRALRQKRIARKKPVLDKHSVLSNISVELLSVKEGSQAPGSSIEELKFRKKTGATIIAVERGGHMHTSPDPSFKLKTGDIVFITGSREDINKAIVYLSEEAADSTGASIE